jgi:integrase
MVTKRRGHNEGSVFYREDKNSWRALITIDGRRLSHNGKTRQECQTWLKETLKQVDNGMSYNAAQTKVIDFLEEWLVSIKSKVKPHTLYQYDMTIHKHALPYIGKFAMKDLRADHIQKLYDKEIEIGTGKHTVEIMHRILHKAFKHALILRIIPYNPTEGVLVPKPEEKEMKFYDEIQANQFLLAVKGTRNEVLYHLVLSTGMRESEVLALKWSDLDWKNKTISIKRQLVQAPSEKKGYFGSLKTSSANRTISLGDHTIQKLREHLNAQTRERKKGLTKGRWTDYDMIFPSLVGTPMHQINMYESFKRAIRQSGLPIIRFHDLRHTAASLMLNHGVPVLIVSKRLGHAKVSITLDTYGHLIPQMQEGVGQLMDDLISPIELSSDAFCAPFEIIEKE